MNCLIKLIMLLNFFKLIFQKIQIISNLGAVITF